MNNLLSLVLLNDANTVTEVRKVWYVGQLLTAMHTFAPTDVDVGWLFDAETKSFAPPPPPRWISRLAFMDRLGDTFIAIQLASEPPTRGADETDAAFEGRRQLAAALRADLAKTNSSKYIDLDRPDVLAGLQKLEAVGLLAAGRALQIVTDPILPQEAYT
jgi:hypothetical protein